MSRMTGDGDAARFGQVFVLPMAALCRRQVPAIGLYQSDHVTYLHPRSP